MTEGIVYTAQFGPHDWSRHTNSKSDLAVQTILPDWRYIIFTDQLSIKQNAQKCWEVNLVSSFSTLEGPLVRSSRLYKALPHLVLPKSPASLWIDFKCGKVTDKPNRELKNMKEDIGFLSHTNNVAREFKAVFDGQKYTDKNILDAQQREYTKQGFDLSTQVVACTVILRKHTPQIEQFNNAWWEQQCRYVYRDQLSVNYLLWKLQIPNSIVGDATRVGQEGF